MLALMLFFYLKLKSIPISRMDFDDFTSYLIDYQRIINFFFWYKLGCIYELKIHYNVQAKNHIYSRIISAARK